MNKTKKAVAELRAYLGRDARGIELLDEISRQSTQSRKESVEAVESVNKLLSVVEERDSQISHQQTEIATRKKELGVTRDRLKQREVRIAALEKTIESLESKIDGFIGEPPPMVRAEIYERKPGEQSVKFEKDLPPLLRDYRKFSDLLKALRREQPICPAPRFREGRSRHPTFSKRISESLYDLGDFATSYSRNDVHTLGMFVMCHTLMFGECSIFYRMKWGNTIVDGKTMSPKLTKQMLGWFAPNNLNIKTENEIVAGYRTGPGY